MTLYCLLTQAQRSVAHALPLLQSDWPELQRYYEGHRVATIQAVLTELKSRLGSANLPDRERSRRESNHRLRIVRLCLPFYLLLWQSPRAHYRFPKYEIHDIACCLSDLCRQLNNSKVDNNEIVALRVELTRCQGIMESRCGDRIFKENQAIHVENFGQPNHSTHFSIEEITNQF